MEQLASGDNLLMLFKGDVRIRGDGGEWTVEHTGWYHFTENKIYLLSEKRPTQKAYEGILEWISRQS